MIQANLSKLADNRDQQIVVNFSNNSPEDMAYEWAV